MIKTDTSRKVPPVLDELTVSFSTPKYLNCSKNFPKHIINKSYYKGSLETRRAKFR